MLFIYVRAPFCYSDFNFYLKASNKEFNMKLKKKKEVKPLNTTEISIKIYEIIKEFLQYVSCEEISKNENSLLNTFFAHFEKMQENPKCQ